MSHDDEIEREYWRLRLGHSDSGGLIGLVLVGALLATAWTLLWWEYRKDTGALPPPPAHPASPPLPDH